VKNNKDLSFYFIDCSYGDEKTSTKWATNKNVNELKLMSINPFLFISELIRFKKFVQENNIQLVHVHHRRLVIILTIFKFYLKIPLLYTSHLTYPKNIIFKLIAQLSCIAISESVESNLYETTSSKDITLLANPVEFNDINLPENSFSLDQAITIGRLEEVKGINYIIDAFAILHAKGLKKRLLIVGEGGEESDLKHKVSSYGLDHYIKFVGYSKNVNQHIDKAAFSILHSSIEGLPLVTVESAARFKPSLVTNVAGSRDTVPTNVELPNLVDFSNVQMLAKTLEVWFASPSLIKSDGDKFRLFLQSKCSTKIVADGYYTKYTELINATH
jgi:glycosyltransferase involved in cell wall biosynthesis